MNNMIESFNSERDKYRSKLILTMLESVRRKVMKSF